MMPRKKPHGEIDMSVLEELIEFLGQSGDAGDEPGEEGGQAAIETVAGATPGASPLIPDGSTGADSEMQGGGTCPHCGKPL